jgi:hypothetical protein
MGSLRYHWPHYLPIDPVADFFKSTRNGILQALAHKKVLESCSNTLECPSSLTYVQPEYRDDSGDPFTLGEHTAFRYLSTNYPHWEVDHLIFLGVSAQTTMEFLADLQILFNSTVQKPATWHTQLAEAVLPLLCNTRYLEKISHVKLIPLRGGGWASMREGPIYFSCTTRMPEGLEMKIVDAEAEKDVSRRNLFRCLGVKNCGSSQLCYAIISSHCSGLYAPSLTLAESVSQITYLYSREWTRSETSHFWLATTNGDFRLGSDIHIRPSAKDNSIHQRIYDSLQNDVPLLHDSYAAAMSTFDHRWRVWMSTSFDVCLAPQLVRMIPGSKFEPTPEMKSLFVNGNSRDVLLFLRDHWSIYSRWIEDKASSTAAPTVYNSVRECLGQLQMRCRNGLTVAMHNTFLPSLDSEVEMNQKICILDVPEQTVLSWSFLEFFGVTVKVDVQYYVHCLHILRDRMIGKHLAVHIYEKLQALYGGNENLVQ